MEDIRDTKDITETKNTRDRGYRDTKDNTDTKYIRETKEKILQSRICPAPCVLRQCTDVFS